MDYLDNGNITGAKEYLNGQNKDLAKNSFREYCKNPVANSIFRIYERRVNSDNISFAVFAQISKELPFTSPELCSVLSNILENAYEACKKSRVLNPHISLNASSDEQRLLIELRNTVSVETKFYDGMPVSTKNNGGTGTKSIKSIVTKHNGMVEYSQCQEEFITRIIVPF